MENGRVSTTKARKLAGKFAMATIDGDCGGGKTVTAAAVVAVVGIVGGKTITTASATATDADADAVDVVEDCSRVTRCSRFKTHSADGKFTKLEFIHHH